MLSILNEFFSKKAELLYDIEQKMCFLMVEKNASTSQYQLGNTMKDRFKYVHWGHGADFLKENNIKDLTVFLREPIDRFKSGLAQTARYFGFNQRAIDYIVFGQDKSDRINYDSNSAHIYPIDNHMSPQFWTLLRVPKELGITFHFIPLSQYSIMYPFADRSNSSLSNNDTMVIPQATLDKINLYLTEDLVLYYQFLNSTATLDQILDKIKLEENFVEEVAKYDTVLNMYQNYYR